MTTPDPTLSAAQQYAGGDAEAGEKLCHLLAAPVRAAASRFLGADAAELDDVVQESLLAVLGYLRKAGRFEGDLIRFAVTVARNRCRNLLIWRRRHPGVDLEPLAAWIADPERSALDSLLEDEVQRVVQAGLDSLDPSCRDLLRWSYFQDVAIETIRRRIGLDTVQGVYYRRAVCLQRLARFLNSWLARGS
jgi:RNA polymerase sigma factor (sigma-70 family)